MVTQSCGSPARLDRSVDRRWPAGSSVFERTVWACLAAAIAALGSPTIARAESPDAKSGAAPAAALAGQYGEHVRPLLQKYCFECHSTAKHKGDLDLERFATLDDARHDVEVWRAVLEMLESGQMPPEDAPQPSAAEHERLAGWTSSLLDSEILARAGDPGA